MIVRLRTFGELERLVDGERPGELPDDATLSHLLDADHERWARSFEPVCGIGRRGAFVAR